jgi:solute carrier family 35, member E1
VAKASKPVNISSLTETLTTGGYFALWYLFSVAYNVYNKQSLSVLDFPFTIAFIQMAVGCLYFVPLWLLGIRKAPKLRVDGLKRLIPIALCHAGVHVGSVVIFGAGSVWFAHIVSASEPVVECGANILLRTGVPPICFFLPLVFGCVAIASVKFTFLALMAAKLSNMSSSTREVLSKKSMSRKEICENVDAPNLYSVLTAISTVLLIPTFLAFEGMGFFSAFSMVVKDGSYTTRKLFTLLLLSGASYYAYNESAFLALGRVNPVTQAIGNAITRVLIIVASVVALSWLR